MKHINEYPWESNISEVDYERYKSFKNKKWNSQIETLKSNISKRKFVKLPKWTHITNHSKKEIPRGVSFLSMSYIYVSMIHTMKPTH